MSITVAVELNHAELLLLRSAIFALEDRDGSTGQTSIQEDDKSYANTPDLLSRLGEAESTLLNG